MPNLRQMDCCAVSELIYLSQGETAEENMEDINLEEMRRRAFIVFSGVITLNAQGETPQAEEPYFWDFVRLIRTNNLGTVRVNRPRYNSNSGNTVSIAVWVPDHDAVERWKNGRRTDR